MENKSTNLEFTGERYLPEVDGQVQLEHLHRYSFVQSLVAGKLVLDIASGEGYGSFMLSSTASQVTGVDISDDAINHASLKYRKENLKFLVGSCSEIPLGDNSVDVVVSFETIEHHDLHEEMMAEIRRVMKNEGLLIISSPNKYEYSDVPQYSNEYHVKELYREELVGLLERYFSNMALLNQRVIYGSAIASNSSRTTLSTFNKNNEGDISCTEGVPRPVYDIAIASDYELPEVGSSIFEGDIETLTQPYEKHITHLVQTIESVVEDRDAKEAEIELVVKERDMMKALSEKEGGELNNRLLSVKAIQEAQRLEVEQLKAKHQKVNAEHQNHISKLSETLDSVIVDRDARLNEVELLRSNADTWFSEREALLNELETLRNKT